MVLDWEVVGSVVCVETSIKCLHS